ncbi:MAG: hypothetical protein ACI92A_000841, partial [Candidatus Paceibacteria bacterium]
HRRTRSRQQIREIIQTKACRTLFSQQSRLVEAPRKQSARVQWDRYNKRVKPTYQPTRLRHPCGHRAHKFLPITMLQAKNQSPRGAFVRKGCPTT